MLSKRSKRRGRRERAKVGTASPSAASPPTSSSTRSSHVVGTAGTRQWSAPARSTRSRSHPRPGADPSLHAGVSFLLLISRQGKVRLAKWYTTMSPRNKCPSPFSLPLRDSPSLTLVSSSTSPSSPSSRSLSRPSPLHLVPRDSQDRQGRHPARPRPTNPHVQLPRVQGCAALSSSPLLYPLVLLTPPRPLSQTPRSCTVATRAFSSCAASARRTTSSSRSRSSTGALASLPLSLCSHRAALTSSAPYSYVEVLDRYFGNVCELDLCVPLRPPLPPPRTALTHLSSADSIFNYQKAYAVRPPPTTEHCRSR